MNTNGLTTKEVIESKKKYGTNIIAAKKNNSFIKLLLESLGDPIIKILIIALGIKIVFLLKDFDWYETIGIVIAIFIASFISSISEYGSEKAFIKLQEESSKIKCRVKRNGKIEEIFIEDVVVGDIVILEAGDKIPADGIIIEGDIYVDESSLNGEAKEIHKKPSIINETKESLVYRGTVVYSKMLTMKENDVDVDLIISRDIKDLYLSDIPDELAVEVCKIIGVYLDNALEEVSKYEEKIINIEFYAEKKTLCIAISNNFEGEIDFEKMDNPGYTTKENGHGYGLLLAHEIIESNDRLSSEREIKDNIFKQILKIKM